MMKKTWLSLMAMLTACTITRLTPAPVVNVTAPAAPIVSATPPAVSTPVASQTTLHKIDSDDDAPVINSTPPVKNKKSSPVTTNTPNAVSLGGIDWLVPTNGKIQQQYTPATKGVDVVGKEGQAIFAAAAGKVVYSGNGLKGYGNLIIIKHQDNYLTAYSHNKVNLVTEGSQVSRGQKIAELGRSDSDKPVLHFELRKNGKPVDPTSIFSH